MDNLLLEVGGKDYYIDVDELSASICVENKETEKNEDGDLVDTGLKIDIANTKYIVI